MEYAQEKADAHDKVIDEEITNLNNQNSKYIK